MSPSPGSMRIVPTLATMSPTTTARWSSSQRQTCPGACPGVCRTLPSLAARRPSSRSRRRPRARRATGTRDARGRLGVRPDGQRRARARARRAPPTWSGWWCVAHDRDGRAALDGERRAPSRSTRAARPRRASPARRAPPRARRARSCWCASPAGASASAPRRARSSARAPAGRMVTRRGSALDDEGERLAAADAERGEPALRVAVLHRVEQRRQDARAARADGMPERDRAAADVHLLRVEPAELVARPSSTTANASLIS